MGCNLETGPRAAGSGSGLRPRPTLQRNGPPGLCGAVRCAAASPRGDLTPCSCPSALLNYFVLRYSLIEKCSALELALHAWARSRAAQRFCFLFTRMRGICLGRSGSRPREARRPAPGSAGSSSRFPQRPGPAGGPEAPGEANSAATFHHFGASGTAGPAAPSPQLAVGSHFAPQPQIEAPSPGQPQRASEQPLGSGRGPTPEGPKVRRSKGRTGGISTDGKTRCGVRRGQGRREILKRSPFSHRG